MEILVKFLYKNYKIINYYHFTILQEVPDDESHLKAKTKTLLKISLSPCNVTIDPGFYDRIYMLMFYNELDPNCLVTPAIRYGINLDVIKYIQFLIANYLNVYLIKNIVLLINSKFKFFSSLLHDDEDLVVPGLSLILTCPQLNLDFYVPKVDMRKASEMSTEEFVALFWARKIHPELIQLRLRKFEMRLKQDAGPKSPLAISLNSDFIDILFKEDEHSEKLPLAVVRKSQRNAEDPFKRAARISITLNMDDSQRLQVPEYLEELDSFFSRENAK